MSSRLTRLALARDRARRAKEAMPVTATLEEHVRLVSALKAADARWREELARVAEKKGPVAA